MLQDFAVGLWFRRLQKRVRKIRFFLYCIQDSPILSFHLQKSRLYVLIFWLYPLLCKGHLSFLTCAGEILQLPLPTILDVYFRFLTTPGVRRGKNAFSPPHIGVIALSSAGSLVTITGDPYSIGQGNRQSRRHRPRRFSTAPLISTSNWTHNPLSYCQTPGSMAGRRSCFTK